MRYIGRLIITAILLGIIQVVAVSAQIDIPVECGSIVEGEITTDIQRVGQNYSISLSPVDIIRYDVVPVANTFAVSIGLFDPSGRLVKAVPGSEGRTVSIEEQIPATGNYRINAVGSSYAYVGAYTLYIGCTLRDGTVIAPGSTAAPAQPVVAPAVQPVAPVVSAPAFGFIGLPPVDFTTATLVPLALGQALQGTVQPTGNAIVGFTFSGTQGQIADINFARTSGDLNLGLAIIRTNTNELAFFTALVNSDLFISRVFLPATGDYTVAVFRLDIVPPVNPQSVTYQVTVSLQ
jgi:hypothetical protein